LSAPPTSRSSLLLPPLRVSPSDPLRELFESCKCGDVNKVKELVNAANVNARDTAGRRSSPLHFAAGYGRREAVEHLLHVGGDVRARDDGGLIPLHNACSFGHAEVVSLLLQASADPNATDSWNYTPLHEAAIKGKTDVCVLLLQHGADPTIRNSEGKTSSEVADPITKPVLVGEYKKDELLEASRSGNEEKLMCLLTPLNVNCHASDGRKSTPLHLAAGYNRTSIVQLILQHGADVHAKDKGGLVPLHNACSYGHFEVTELLIRHGANVNAMDLWQFTPLHEAASKGRNEVCSLLMSHGADPLALNCHAKSAIDVAQSQELKDRLLSEFKGHTLLESCRQADVAKVKKSLSPDTINFKHPYSYDTPMHCAAVSAFPKRKVVVETLYRKGANLNDKNKDQLMPLHLAADKSHYDVVDVLLKQGAKVNALDSAGQTALHRCARADNVQACRILLNFGADPSIISLQGYTAAQLASDGVAKLLAEEPIANNPVVGTDVEYQLLEAAKAGDMELVKKIVGDHSHIVNCRDLDGRHSTPLHFAAGYNRVGVVEFLLSKAADVHAKDKGGLVPLHNACSYGHYEVTELLVKHGASVNVSDLWKFTPLHEASAKGKYEIVRLLLRHGADPTKKNRDGHTPVDLVKEGDQDVLDLLRGDSALLDAAKKGNLGRVQKLLSAENVNCRDSQGRNSTPLHLAAGYNNLEVAEFLLENGSDVNAQDKGGLIPLHNASSYGHLDIAALLIRYHTVVNATDKWGFTPIHEAAQKGRTQLCALLVSCQIDFKFELRLITPFPLLARSRCGPHIKEPGRTEPSGVGLSR
jgi:tankyrase